jgi:integrase
MSVRRSHLERRGLEALSLAPATHQQYHIALRNFLTHLNYSLRQLTRHRSRTIDSLLCDYLNYKYQHDGSYAQAAHAVFALIAAEPRFQYKLARSRRALKGWDRHRTKRSHPPLTWELTVAIAMTMAKCGRHAEAMATLLAFDCYLRISEFTRLRRHDIALPLDARLGGAASTTSLRLADTKTGPNKYVTVWDPQVASALQSFLTDSSARPDDLLFPFSAASYRALMHSVCAELDLSEYHIVPHSLRHGGATRDFMRHNDVTQVMHRGRWASTKSAARYIQQGPAQLLQQHGVPARLTQLGHTLAASLAACLQHLRDTVPSTATHRPKEVRFHDQDRARL